MNFQEMIRSGSRGDPDKVYKYTEEELDEIIKETWIKDCKVDACMDKFFSQLVQLDPKSWPRKRRLYSPPKFTDKSITKLEGLEPLKQELCSDLETFVPGYFDGLGPSATVDDKFRTLHGKAEGAFQRWSDCYGREPPEKGEFRDVLVNMLADKHLEKLRQTSRLGSDDAGSGPASLGQGSLNQVLKQLRSSIEGEQATASFTCGGSIAVGSSGAQTPSDQIHSQADIEGQESEKGAKVRKCGEHSSETDIGGEAKASGISKSSAPCTSAPVSIYWSPEGNGHAKRLSLPLEKVDESGTNPLTGLVHDCAPATFGRGDKDVLDPEYRSAGKLDTDNFCTTFHPADFGILETIEQILLPSVSSSGSETARFRRVRAELYKLNIYSGPSGIFRKHVDTPRSPYQFGSLVVCLPSVHKGGSLLVRHNGQSVEFDWSSLSSSRIQWAAFYSDCEHEITRVSEGHRITLTYNLLIAEPIGASLIPNPVVEARSFPLYAQVKNMIEQPGFFKDGGVLGFFCSHSYAHASDTAAIDLPRKLKGSDMVLFAVLQALGLLVKVLPVLEDYGKYFPPDESLGTEPKVARKDGRHYQPTGGHIYFDKEALEIFREKGYMINPMRFFSIDGGEGERTDFKLYYQKMSYYDYDCEDIEKRWKALLMGSRPSARKCNEGSIVGNQLHPRKLSDLGGEDISSNDVSRHIWPSYFLPGITWITSPKDEATALSHMCYGNEASLGTRYSCAAIIAIVPPWDQRAETTG